MRIVIVHDQVIGLFDSVLFVRLYVLPVSRESESGRYKRAEYERDRVSLVPAPPPLSICSVVSCMQFCFIS